MGKVCTFPKAIPDYTWASNNNSNMVVQVALGEAHTLVLTATGTLFSFGWNEFGQLGVPTAAS